MLKLLLSLAIVLSSADMVCAAQAQSVAQFGHLGVVRFPISCSSALQKSFERGVSLLHSFWYEEARKEFESITRQDPHCDMAYWGIAMSYWPQLMNWPDENEMQAARDSLAKVGARGSRRERAYVRAIALFYDTAGPPDPSARADAYSDAMNRLYHHYPKDHEAAAFYALSLLASEPENEKSLAHRRKAADVLERLFSEVPDHPGAAHYLIHTYDQPQLARLGLPAARKYAIIASSSPHALHMPSHIFARLGMWQEDIDSNLASLAASGEAKAMHMAGGAHQFHAMDYLIYAYLQCGREAEAAQLIEKVKSMRDDENFTMGGIDWHLYAEAEYPAVFALELHHWREATVLQPIDGAPMIAQSITYWARAIGAGQLGNAAEASSSAEKALAIHKQMLDTKQTYFVESVGNLALEAMAWADYANGKTEQSVQMLGKIAEEEEATSIERPFILVPAREMLGDMLLNLKKSEQALSEYKLNLELNPNRFDSIYGAARAAELSGKHEEAKAYYAQLVKVCKGADSSRPELTFAQLQ
jgi:tetratricopeptide (TPR) repeat protein